MLWELKNVVNYNSIADFCYQNLSIGNNVFIEGFLRIDGNIEIKSIEYLKMNYK